MSRDWQRFWADVAQLAVEARDDPGALEVLHDLLLETSTIYASMVAEADAMARVTKQPKLVAFQPTRARNGSSFSWFGIFDGGEVTPRRGDGATERRRLLLNAEAMERAGLKSQSHFMTPFGWNTIHTLKTSAWTPDPQEHWRHGLITYVGHPAGQAPRRRS